MDLPKEDDMRHRFYEKLNDLVASKGHNTQFFTETTYAAMIRKVKISMSKVSQKKPEDYQRLKRFNVATIEGVERLIVPAKKDNVIKIYVFKEEIFQILHDTHSTIGHSGRNRMAKELNWKYKNITREMIAMYLSLCETCEKRYPLGKNSMPILTATGNNELKARCQVDIIDMQSNGDDPYNFILVYQDDLTKFVQLRPLMSNSVEEIAYVLLEIVTIFGIPSILQSSNGREFASAIVEELSKMWPDLKIVHGAVKPLNNKESEKVYQEIENDLKMWLEENNTKKWSEGLRFVQLKKNATHNIGMNCSPYEAMFGTKLKLGLKNTVIPQEALNNINTEEDLELFLNIQGKMEMHIDSP